MRQQTLFLFALVLICHAANCWGREEYRKNKRYSLIGRSSIYDYAAIAPKISLLKVQQQQQRSVPTTTQRPLVRYWQNLMRNVRLNMSTLPWNITNPLANLFNAGVSNVLETPPVVIQQQYVTTNNSGKRKSSPKHRKSPSVHNKKRKNAHQKTHEEDYELQRRQTQPLQAYLPQQSYPSFADLPAKPMYFYYPNAEQYLQLQKLRTRGHYVQDNYYYDKDNYYDEENETHDEESDFVTATPAIDDAEEYNDVADTAAATAESDSNERNEYANDVTSEEDTKDEIDQSDSQSAESLRTLIGNYVDDDHANKLRQPATLRYDSSSRNAVKLEPQNNYQYYVLQPYKLRSV